MGAKAVIIGGGAGLKWGFSGELLLKAFRTYESNALWSLLGDFSYTALSGRTFTAPKGMVTDLASIPVLFKSMFSNFDHRLAGVIHDALYLFALRYGLTRAECDDLFQEMCACLGASDAAQWLGHTGLQVGGWHSWDECRQLGVRWGDFDTSQLSAQEIADYRLLYDLDRFAA